MIVTTSWDDGDHEDLGVKRLMDRYGIRGTFYIAKNYRSRALSPEDIRYIATTQEIGAHTLSHPDLAHVSLSEQAEEICGSKKWLESIIGKNVQMFCYPGGSYSQSTVDIVRDCGYRGARTTKVGHFERVFDPYEMGVSMTFYPRRDLTFGRRYVQPLIQKTWAQHIIQPRYPRLLQRLQERFEQARSVDGIFHLYGHSWTNARYNLHPVLDEFFASISNLDNCEYLTNGEIVERLYV